MRRSLALVSIGAVMACGGAEAPRPADTPPPPSSAAVSDKHPASEETHAVVAPSPEPALPNVELVEVDLPPTPSKMPGVTIASPARGQLVPAAKAGELAIKLAVRDWDIGPGREHLCASLDGGACVRIDDAKKPMKLSDLSPKLSEGQHVLAIVARHKTGEAVRGKGASGAFAAVSFFVEKKGKAAWKDGDPLIVALAPDDGTPHGDVLIDYFVGNALVADGKYLAQIAVAGPGLNRSEASSSGKPFRVKNARAGSYLLRVALARYSPDLGESGTTTTVKYSSKTLVGPMVDVTRNFRIAD